MDLKNVVILKVASRSALAPPPPKEFILLVNVGETRRLLIRNSGSWAAYVNAFECEVGRQDTIISGLIARL